MLWAGFWPLDRSWDNSVSSTTLSVSQVRSRLAELKEIWGVAAVNL